MNPHDIRLAPSLRLGYLPLVMDVYRRSGLPAFIDEKIPKDPRSLVSTSECIAVILCGVYVGAHSLWRLRERLAMYDMATIMQKPGFILEPFTEERLARALDEMYLEGLDGLMTGLALRMIKAFRLGVSFLHFDATSFSFYGSYEREDPFAGLPGVERPPSVVYGYSKDHRPDLKQVLFGSLVTDDGGVPLWGKVLPGNCTDNEAAAMFFAKVSSLVQDPTQVCCVADSKGWCASTVDIVTKVGLRLLSRLPRNRCLHKQLMAHSWTGYTTMERPARIKEKEPERYEYLGFDAEEEFMLEIGQKDGTKIKQTFTIPVRAVRVFSSSLVKLKMKTADRLHEREQRKALKQIADWQDIAYACRADADRAALRNCSQAEFMTIDLSAEVKEHDGPLQRKRGRPRNRPEPELAAGKHWRVRYTMTKVGEHVTAQRLHDSCSFIQIRNRVPGWEISDEDMILHYKGQYHNEHGFSWLKSGADINPMFIETPHRIASMGFIYCIGLMYWTLIQRTVRAYLKANGMKLPYHRNKPSDNITTLFLLELFPHTQTIEMKLPDGGRVRQTLGYDGWQRLAAQALGTSDSAFMPVD
jgi:transposase